jgi:integrase
VYKVTGCANYILSWRALDGTRQTKSSGTPRKGVAEDMLDDILSGLRNGENITATKTKLTFKDAADALIVKATLEGLASLEEIKRRITLHLEPFFGPRRLLVSIDTDLVRKYILKRQTDTICTRKARRIVLEDESTTLVPEQRKPVSPAEINRELAVLSRIFTVAGEDFGFRHRPTITKLKESRPRQGFFTGHEIERLCVNLPVELAGVVRFGLVTAWRISEVLKLEWNRVDFTGRGHVRLASLTTKNQEARIFPMTIELRQLLEERDRARQAAEKETNSIIPWVFFRLVAQGRGGPKQAKPIIRFNKAWKRACEKAGLPGRIPHDLRRSAIRTFVRKGISENVAMKLSGHKTSSVFRRYDIVSTADLDAAADVLDGIAKQPKPEKHTTRVRAFRKRAS